jgi:hypothetical protein
MQICGKSQIRTRLDDEIKTRRQEKILEAQGGEPANAVPQEAVASP